jgi:hypothetical protein
MFNKILQFTMAAAILATPALAGAATIQLPDTNQTTCFNAGGGQQDCAAQPGGQDGQTLTGVAWPDPRYTDNLDGTVTDNLTGLVWSKHANAPNRAAPGPAQNACTPFEADMTWQQALDFIGCLNTSGFAGFNDWRLPNLNELEGMVNAEAADSSLFLNNSFGFPGEAATQVQNSEYWTSTSDVDAPASAWAVSLVEGDFPASTPKNNVNFTSGVWPVRGVSTAPAQLWRTGQTVCFDEAGISRACAGTGEDGEKLAGAAWPALRFQMDAGATIAADRLTGLMWPTDTQTPGPAGVCNTGVDVSWQGALDHVACLNQNNFLGRADWRVPNRKELRSLIDYSQTGPALPAGHPFATVGFGGFFWSSTTDASNPARAWTINMLDGSINGLNKTAAGNVSPVWPVSGPDVTAPALTMAAVASPTRLASLTVSGTVEAGKTPTVTVTAPATAGAVSVTGGNWSCQISGMTEGVNTVTVSAGDLAGNVATVTAAVTVNLPTGGFTPGAAVTVMDALKALRMAVGLIPAPAAGSAELLHVDVAPLGAPDGVINTADALLILKKAVGLVSF